MDLPTLRRPLAAWKKLTCAVTVLAVTLVAVCTAVPPRRSWGPGERRQHGACDLG